MQSEMAFDNYKCFNNKRFELVPQISFLEIESAFSQAFIDYKTFINSLEPTKLCYESLISSTLLFQSVLHAMFDHLKILPIVKYYSERNIEEIKKILKFVSSIDTCVFKDDTVKQKFISYYANNYSNEKTNLTQYEIRTVEQFNKLFDESFDVTDETSDNKYEKLCIDLVSSRKINSVKDIVIFEVEENTLSNLFSDKNDQDNTDNVSVHIEQVETAEQESVEQVETTEQESVDQESIDQTEHVETTNQENIEQVETENTENTNPSNHVDFMENILSNINNLDLILSLNRDLSSNLKLYEVKSKDNLLLGYFYVKTSSDDELIDKLIMRVTNRSNYCKPVILICCNLNNEDENLLFLSHSIEKVLEYMHSYSGSSDQNSSKSVGHFSCSSSYLF